MLECRLLFSKGGAWMNNRKTYPGGFSFPFNLVMHGNKESLWKPGHLFPAAQQLTNYLHKRQSNDSQIVYPNHNTHSDGKLHEGGDDGNLDGRLWQERKLINPLVTGLLPFKTSVRVSVVSLELKVVSKPETELKEVMGSMCDTANVAEKSKENVIIYSLSALSQCLIQEWIKI